MTAIIYTQQCPNLTPKTVKAMNYNKLKHSFLKNLLLLGMNIVFIV